MDQTALIKALQEQGYSGEDIVSVLQKYEALFDHKNGDGSYLELELTILEGPYKDRKVWDRLCLNHPSQQTVKIARGYLSRWSNA